MSIQTENKNYSVDNKDFKGYLSWDDSVRGLEYLSFLNGGV